MSTITLRGHHPRLRRWKRVASDRVHRLAKAGYAGARRTPMPTAVRHGLRERLTWRPTVVEVPIDRLLLGVQNRASAAEYAQATGDLLWGSRPVVEGPHADLLARAAEGELTDDQILSSAYASMARRAIALSGQYFSATDDEGILVVARDFVRSVVGGPDAAVAARKPHQTPPGVPIRVAPIRESDCYQVVDGHHRIAALAAAGAATVEVQVNRLSVETPLQTHLHRMSWTGGESELYQPVIAPEVAGWPTVRRCDDRFTAMVQLLAERRTGSSYLDVASCYGWFVAAMQEIGHTAEGIERDPLAPELGEAIYGLSRDQITTADAVEFLGATTRTWDVVSCFSLLHHFVLGRGQVDARTLLQLLDKVTGQVLFIDTGQEHERWFATSLAGWDSERVHAFLEAETTFDRVIDLGADQDDRPPYEGNYGRHLFACIRES
jgi:hypothetical protein